MQIYTLLYRPLAVELKIVINIKSKVLFRLLIFVLYIFFLITQIENYCFTRANSLRDRWSEGYKK